MEDLKETKSDEVLGAIREYFTNEELDDLPVALSSRYLNMTKNYLEDSLSGAFLCPEPDFMKNKKKLLEKNAADLDDEKCVKPTSVAPKRKKVKTMLPVKISPERIAPNKKLFKGEQPPEGRYIFCNVCEQKYLYLCSNCVPLASLDDNPVPIGLKDRAKKTVPKGILEVRPSQIHGFGVFAVRNLNIGVWLGPYEGSVTTIDAETGYAWKLRNGKLIDASNERNSNYLRYVNCARNAQEQNLVAFQNKGKLFYRTCREIIKGEELLVFYGRSYAKDLGIGLQKYFQPAKKVLKEFYPCSFCSIGLSTKEYLELHEKRCRFSPHNSKVFDGSTYKCQFCECLFTDKWFFEKHQSNCSKQRSNLKSERQLDDHTNMKLKRKFQCKYCDFSSSKKYNTTKHVLTKHEINNATWHHCRDCDFKTILKSNLRRHSRIHEKFKLLKCTECQKGFNHKFNLDDHTLRHHPQSLEKITSKIHICGICKFKTVKKSELTQHKYRHDEENAPKYQCSKCTYSSIQKEHLKKHLLRHSDERPFVCPKCKKGFVEKKCLDSHILNNHKDEDQLLNIITHKIHQCSSCEYRSVLLTSIKKHLKTHK